jgi:glycine betaine/proline transport system ATP-binding protein
MEPLEIYRTGYADDELKDCPNTHPEADLDQLIDIMVDTDKPIRVVENGKCVGVVTKRSLLRGIQGKETRQNPLPKTQL